MGEKHHVKEKKKPKQDKTVKPLKSTEAREVTPDPVVVKPKGKTKD